MSRIPPHLNAGGYGDPPPRDESRALRVVARLAAFVVLGLLVGFAAALLIPAAR